MPVPASSILPTLDELKTHVNITSTTHDDELQDMLDAAAEVVAHYVGPLDSETVTEIHYDSRRMVSLLLRNHPVLSVTSITDGNGVVLDADTYTVDTGTGIVRFTGYTSTPYFLWWGDRGDLTVGYEKGRSTLPAAVRLAVLIVAARLWETQRGTAPSALPVTDEAGFPTDPGSLPLLPPRARELLAPYLLGPVIA